MEYFDDEGLNGEWQGNTFEWSWKDYLTSLDKRLSTQMFRKQNITRFVCRALPFDSPYPDTKGTPHWEFTVFLADGTQVGLHPPGKKNGTFSWSAATDEDRASALAEAKCVSDKIRACYFDTSRARKYPQGPTHTQFTPADTLVLLGTQMRSAGVVVST